MSISLRYTLYICLMAVGACSYHGEDRGEWDTIFADATSCKTAECKAALERDRMDDRSRGGKR